jgi:hypothetical protein
MIGYAYAAGDRRGSVRANAGKIAEYFSLAPGLLGRVMDHIETDERPHVVLLQNTAPEASVGAVTFYSSVWSKSYARVGTAYGAVHRDFHYQCFFVAIAALVEVGCVRVRIENPMSEHPWKRDAYICLLEAVRNVRRNMNPKMTVHLESGTYDARMVQRLDDNELDFDLQEHRPIGVRMHIFEGLNMRTVFVEDARTALRNA